MDLWISAFRTEPPPRRRWVWTTVWILPYREDRPLSRTGSLAVSAGNTPQSLSTGPGTAGMALALHSCIMIIVRQRRRDTPGQAQREPQSTNREFDGQHTAQPSDVSVGEVAGRVGDVGAERITLDDGTVLSRPWFFQGAPSQLMQVGTMLNVKYENRDAERVMAFVEVSANSGKETPVARRSQLTAHRAGRAALRHR